MKINRIFAFILAFSFLSLTIQPAIADEYMMLPPILDEESNQQDQPLPGLSDEMNRDINNAKNKEQSDYRYTNDEYNQNYKESRDAYYQNTRNYSYSNEPLKGTISTVPVGTAFQVITNTNINTQRNRVGEIFTTTLNHPISVDGKIIVPAGTEVIGQITYIEEAGRVGKNARMEIKFTSIKPPYSSRIPITGKVLTQDNTGVLKGGSLKNQLVKHVKTGAMTTAGGTIVGTGIGALAGSAGTGAAVGAASGGILSLGWIFWRKGKEVRMPAGTKMVVVLEQPFDVGK